MKKVQQLLGLCLLSLLIMSNSDCNNQPSSNDELAAKQEVLMKEANAQVGMPAIKNYQERKLFKLVLEARDQTNLVCYCYLENSINGTVGQFLGKCLGYGLPYGTQYTNPQSIESKSTYGIAILPQADPNGLFMPVTAEATWIFLINPKTNQPEPVYCEPKVIISPFPLTEASDVKTIVKK